MKAFLNRQATLRLGQIGHTDLMIQEAKREAWWWLKARGDAVRRGRGLLAGQAVIWPSSGRAELVPVEVPLPGRGEVTVELTASVVSPGTERAQYLRLPSAEVSYPYRPGYSASGRVVAAGRDVHGLSRGQLVAVRGVPHASLATVPATLVHAVPTGVPAEDAALVQLGVICRQGLRRARIVSDEPLCILGAGLIGALTQRLAVTCGAGSVTMIARSRQKEALARAGGAARFLSLDADVEEIGALAAPVVIEASGDPGAIELATATAAPGGRIVLLGSPRGMSTLPLESMREKRLRLIGAHVSTLDHEPAASGVEAARAEADAFLAGLGPGGAAVGDLAGDVVDPREVDGFYRRLALAHDVVGARFDWTLIPRSERIGHARLSRLPDLSGRGLELRRRPLPAGGRGRRASLGELPDPLAGASGHLRVGLLGCGDIAVQNAAAVAAAPNAELTACYDPVAELAGELARAHGAVVSPSVEALLDRTDVDAVLLAVPHHLHAPLGRQAAEAGKHLIVEKPPANDLGSAIELVGAAERAGVTLSFCFPHRYEPRVVAARRLIAAGALGEITGGLVSFWMDKPPSYWVGGFSGRSRSTWRSSRLRAGGGVLIMNLSHYVDLLRHLAGLEVDAVTAAAGVESAASDVEDTISVAVSYANGAIGTIVGCTAQRGNWGGNNELRLWGTEGHVVVEPDPRIYTLRAVGGLRTSRWQSLGPFVATSIRTVFVSRFASAVSEGAPPDVTAADGLAVQAFIEAAYRSSELGERVRPGRLLEEPAA